MKIKSSHWHYEIADMHLVPGVTSRSVADALRIVLDDGAQYEFQPNPPGPRVASGSGKTHNNVTLQFRGLFSTAANLGVTVDATTGAVTLAPNPPPAIGAWNFLVAAEFFVDAVQAKDVTRVFRVHVHEFIESVHLTPNPLKVRIGESRKFRVLGRFPDGILGDLTEQKIFTWTAGFPVGAPAAGVELSGNTVKATSRGSATVYVELRDPWRDPAGQLAHNGAGVEVLESLEDLGKATKVESVLPRWRKPDLERGRHVLFLPEAWPSSKKGEFERAAHKLARVTRKRLLEPLGMLRDELSFWLAWVPSPGPGVNTEKLAIETEINGKSERRVLSQPTEPKGGNAEAEWTQPEAYYKIGLPTSACRGKTIAQLQGRWKLLYGIENPPISDFYISMCTNFSRSFVSASANTAFGFNVKNTAAETSPATYSNIGIAQSTLNTFLEHLQFEGAGDAGKLWTTEPNRALIVFLVPHEGRSFNDGKIVLHLGLDLADWDNLFALPVAQGEFDKAHRHIGLEESSTFAHEFCHGVSLGDEYGEEHDETAPVWMNAAVAKTPNLAYVPSKDAATGFAGKVGKWWDWHRIDAASLVKNIAGRARDPELTVDVVSGAGQFREDDTVFLRGRPLTERHLLGPCTIESRTGDSIRISGSFANYVHGRDYIIYRPVVDENGQPLPLTAQFIQDAIEDIELPLNAKRGHTAASALSMAIPSKCSEL